MDKISTKTHRRRRRYRCRLRRIDFIGITNSTGVHGLFGFSGVFISNKGFFFNKIIPHRRKPNGCQRAAIHRKHNKLFENRFGIFVQPRIYFLFVIHNVKSHVLYDAVITKTKIIYSRGLAKGPLRWSYNICFKIT